MIVDSYKGLGATNSQLISSGIATAGATGVAYAVSAGLLASGVAAPIGAAIAIVTAAITALGIGNGCGDKCTIASNDANQAEAAMARNAEAAQSQLVANGGCLTSAEQGQALSNFDNLWTALVNACSDPSLADPGKRCVSERQRGGKYDYFAAHRDPIASMPVCSVPTAVLDTVSGSLSNMLGVAINPMMIAVVGGVLLVGLVMRGKDK